MIIKKTLENISKAYYRLTHMTHPCLWVYSIGLEYGFALARHHAYGF